MAQAEEIRRSHMMAPHRRPCGVCVIMRPLWAPDQTISDVGLSGSRLVKSLTRVSWPQACSLDPGDRHAGDIFYKPVAHTEEVLRVRPRVLYPEEGWHAHVTSWKPDARRSRN
jgi:hypothetical protein